MNVHHLLCPRGRTSSSRLPGKLPLVFLFSALVLTMAMPATGRAQAGPLFLRLGDISVNKLPFVVAYEEGIYRNNGLNIMPKFTPGSVAIIRRSGVEVPDEFILRPGEYAPLRVGGSGPTIVGITTRADARPGPVLLGSTHTRSRWRIISGPAISSPEQLKGKRIGYSGYGPVSHFMAIQFAEAMGWDPRYDVSLMRNGLGTEALKRGYIDAMIGPELHAVMGIYQDDLHAVVDLADYDLPVAGSAMWVDRDWFRDHPVQARAFVKSGIDALAPYTRTGRRVPDPAQVVPASGPGPDGNALRGNQKAAAQALSSV